MNQEECYWSETATFQNILDYQVAREKLNFEKELGLVVNNAKKCWEYISTNHKLDVPHICISLNPITIHLTLKKNDMELYFEIRDKNEVYICYGNTELRDKTYLHLDNLKTSKELNKWLTTY